MSQTIIDVGRLISEAALRANGTRADMERQLNKLHSEEKPAKPVVATRELSLPKLVPVAIDKLPTTTPAELPDMPEMPDAPVVQAMVASFPSAPPPFSRVAPGFTEPLRPAGVPTFTREAPDFQAPTIPNAPTGELPVAPGFQAPALPSAPDIVLPGFDATAPDQMPELEDQTRDFGSNQKIQYDARLQVIPTSADVAIEAMLPGAKNQLAGLIARLTSGLNSGGTGINQDVEQRIIERAKTTTGAEFIRSSADAVKAMAARGFTLPNGVIQATIAQSRSAGMNSIAKAANDLAIAQIELEQKHTQFLLGVVTDLQKTLQSLGQSYFQYIGDLYEKALDHAQKISDLAIKTYESEAKAFELELDKYKAAANVFETLTRASIAQIEIYRAQIEAAKAEVQVDELLVRTYQTQVEAHKTAMDAYAANIRAIVDVANLDKVKLDVFQAQVQAHAAAVSASEAEWTAYSAAIGGNEAKSKAYAAEAQAYAATSSVYSAQVEAESARIKAIAESNRATLGVYEAQVRANAVMAEANASAISSANEVNRNRLLAYQAQYQAQIAAATLNSDHVKAVSSVRIEELKLKSLQDIEYSKMYQDFITARRGETIEVGKVYAGIAQSAMSGVNSLAVATKEGD